MEALEGSEFCSQDFAKSSASSDSSPAAAAVGNRASPAVFRLALIGFRGGDGDLAA